MPNPPKIEGICVVCLKREMTLYPLCEPCGLSYDEKASERSVGDIIIWATDRARYFDRRRR